MKPWLDPIIVSGSLHVYVSQTARGELVMGASLDPYELHSTRSTLDFVEGLAAQVLELFPCLSHVKVVRQWAGMADMTPEFAPIMGLTSINGFYLDAGWGTWGFKATPVSGKTMAYTVDTAIALCGTSVNELLLQTCNINFRALSLEERPVILTSMVGVAVTIIPGERAGAPFYRIWCDGTFGVYIWRTLLAIAQDLGGGAVGAEIVL